MHRLRPAGAILAMWLAGCGGGGGGNGEAPFICGPYPPQADSPYVLPFQVGESYSVKQGNCHGVGAHAVGARLQYAYDFRMDIGTPVVASRGGAVVAVIESYPDFNHTPGEANAIAIQHGEDGTIAVYAHLTLDGALVNVGDVVQQGDIIGLSGASGDINVPHLHFHVEACSGCESIAVTFLNTRPHPNGLVHGETYTAEPY
jgi:murein DD-endopeptidase MepM/ murein hydrolase activator NlpD